MNVKKAVIESISCKLKKEQNSLRYKITRNKQIMSKLVDEQTIAKRELAELENIINSLQS